MRSCEVVRVQMIQLTPFRLGVAYADDHGHRDVHAVTRADYPMILMARATGRLQYATPEARQLAGAFFAARTKAANGHKKWH